MKEAVRSAANAGVFACVCIVTTLSPWLFASWETWWFWPFALVIFIGTAFLGLGLLTGRGAEEATGEKPFRRWARLLVIFGYALFLVYALARWVGAEVYTDAERSFLLLLTPFLLALIVFYGCKPWQKHILFYVILANLTLMGVYGIANHFITGSRYVLWVPGYEVYVAENRLTGSYFCPDHFAGAMEIGLGLALGILFSRSIKSGLKIWAGLFVAIALTAIVLSKSRGGGLTVFVMGAVVLAWGFSQWPVRTRWWWRITTVCVAALLMMIFLVGAKDYVMRFKTHFGAHPQDSSLVQKGAIALQALKDSCRGQMYSAAYRAFKTAPVAGIGPGMHQNLWPHFAASPDGDREEGVWPRMANYDFHSYEVHNDWLQLLEEYGLIGLVLFMVPFLAVFAVLTMGVNEEARRWRLHNWRSVGSPRLPIIMGGLFSAVAMAFHSLGDFNMQMPANAWMLATVLALAIAAAGHREDAAF